MADIIDINVYETVETVTINAQPNLTTINVNSVTSAPQVNSDWNATSGVEEILNKPTIPTQTSQLTNNGADGTNPFITALDIPTAGQAGTLVREVKNMTGATLTKGTVVYISGANGNKPLVSKALATTDVLSARTFGLLQSSISNNGLGYCVIIGDLSGLDTSAFTEGAQLYLSGVTAGTYTDAKILAPTHLVYIGKVTRSHPTQGQIEVGIQNGYELEEIHDVAISSVADKQLLSYDVATDLWKNKSVTTADIADSTNKRYVTDANLTTIGNQSGTNTGDETTATIKTKLGAATTSLDGYLTSTNWNTFNGKFNLPSLTSGSVLFSNGTTIAQKNSNFFWDNTNNRLGIGNAAPEVTLDVTGIGRFTSGARFNNVGVAYSLWGQNGSEIGANGSHFIIQATNGGNTSFGSVANLGAKVGIKAPGALSTDIALRVRNSADTADLATIGGNGDFTIGNTNPSTPLKIGINSPVENIIRLGISYDSLRSARGAISWQDVTGQITSKIHTEFDGSMISMVFGSLYNGTYNSNNLMIIRGNGNVGIGTTSPVAKLQIDSTTQGFLPPRMTNAQRIAISTPAVGLMVYCTDAVEGLYINKSTGWTFIV